MRKITMARKASDEQFSRIKQAVQALDPATRSEELRSHPEYPQHICPVGPDEEYLIGLLDWAWLRVPAPPWPDGSSDEELLRPRHDAGKGINPKDKSINPNTALYRVQGSVHQLVADRTRQVTSVLGRIGVLEIYKEQLERRLSG